MTFTAVQSKDTEGLIQAALRGILTEAQARLLANENPEVIAIALLAASKRIGELQATGQAQQASPSTPSGMVPIYTKANTSRRRKKPGAKEGHPGHRRGKPERIDQHKTHRLECCPHCDGPVQRCQRKRTRTIEDIPEEIQPVVTEHTIWRDYCPKCKKHVEPVVPDAMPGATLGHQVIGLTSWLHYGLGVTIDQIIDILSYHLQTELTPGGLINAWQRLSEILLEWYEQIAREAKNSAYLHADETGWRINGQGCWLWCFANERNCYYMIEYCRGKPVLQKFFTEAFDGVLITDFWAAYDSVEAADRQKCLPHLLRDLEKVDGRNDSLEWQEFAKKLRRLLRDGIRLRKRTDFTPQRYRNRIDRLNRRIGKMAAEEHTDADAHRLTKRLRRYGDCLFTFLEYTYVPHDNNFGERQIRPAVILRKNSQSNRSDRGAASQVILMSIYRTLRLRGHNPTKTITNALKTYLITGKLPPLPD